MDFKGCVPDSSFCLERRRRSYSKQELTLLNAEYALCPYPSQPQRRRIADYLNIPEPSVLWWFQNKRRSDRMQRGRSKGRLVLRQRLPRPSPYKQQNGSTQHENGFHQNGFQQQTLREMSHLSDLSPVPATPTSTHPQANFSMYPERQIFHQQYEPQLPCHHNEPSVSYPSDLYPPLTPESFNYATDYHHQNCVFPAPAVVPSFDQVPFQWNPYWDHNQSWSPAYHYQNYWCNSTDSC